MSTKSVGYIFFAFKKYMHRLKNGDPRMKIYFQICIQQITGTLLRPTPSHRVIVIVPILSFAGSQQQQQR